MPAFPSSSSCCSSSSSSCFFFFNDTATTEIYTLSLHDALPISRLRPDGRSRDSDQLEGARTDVVGDAFEGHEDRKSTRLNSSHLVISYAVFCLKKKNSEPLETTAKVLKPHD